MIFKSTAKSSKAYLDKETFILQCTCTDPEHVIWFSYYNDEKDFPAEMYITYHLQPVRKWYKRIWIAIKYIFGYTSKYGEYDEILLKQSDVEELTEALIRLQNNMKACNQKFIDKVADERCQNTPNA